MSLSLEQIKESLTSPSKTRVIKRAAYLEEVVRFHTDTNLNEANIARASSDFLAWVKGLLPEDKYRIFLQLYRFPLYTPSVVESIYIDLGRVFDSRNYSSTYQFVSSELLDDWDYYKLHNLRSPVIWKTEGWDKMKTAPNSILIVDLPAEQTTEKPEPYFYWLDILNVIDYRLKPDGVSFEWIIFKQPNNVIAVFDDTRMRTYQSEESYTKILGQLTDTVHNLGYCPARFYWSEALNSKEPDLKRNPIVKELSNLNWLLFFVISKRHLDLYAPYPIYSAYETSCDYVNEETQAYCDHGFLRNPDGSYSTLRDGSVEQCPICRDKHLAGPGSLIEVPAPDRDTGDMRNPVQITSIDAASLKYNVDECERLEQLIRMRIVGIGGNISEKEAMNVSQILATFEDKISVLNKLKVNFENAQRFVEETICRLRYGSSFIDLSINYGTEFYIYSIEDLYNKYDIAKKNGATNAELDLLQNQILEVEYKNNPMLLQRLLILKHIEPLRHYTTQEVIQFVQQGLVDVETAILKLNFGALIDRFERENVNIVEFGSKIDFNSKINNIIQILKSYIYETIPTARETVQSPSSGVGQQAQSV
jgi:hypothetical protein